MYREVKNLTSGKFTSSFIFLVGAKIKNQCNGQLTVLDPIAGWTITKGSGKEEGSLGCSIKEVEEQ